MSPRCVEKCRMELELHVPASSHPSICSDLARACHSNENFFLATCSSVG